ncbi:Glycine cleavage system H protein [Wickerhamomyces ciferrii]|uniref:Glycine cleavage system H protein n=1 Tax=Wickerhamomyces ciferrii (strain ATCC 14091 / BCRC 22168 / CBS 111 / JCM 3599 / NBRC 0793 / NRRL Y-1031 F-60-10) TaxID=1206466 RepID=K0KBZ5_WICCF|nr:Glycine cleavage system H protein [Wickerhamomyces ciferrii]CCH42590.1 Glycine cleavage system H protein [Wickerhamomyces ciferrii]
MFSRSLLRSSSATSRLMLNNTLKLSFRYQSSLIGKFNKESLINTYSKGPIDLRFTEDHEYVAAHPDQTAFIGITKYASDAIGDVTFVELPEIGDKIDQGDVIGSIESVKSSNDIFAPISGEVIAINEQLNDNAPLVNSDPLGDGWIVQVKVEDAEQLKELQNEQEYEESLKQDA